MCFRMQRVKRCHVTKSSHSDWMMILTMTTWFCRASIQRKRWISCPDWDRLQQETHKWVGRCWPCSGTFQCESCLVKWVETVFGLNTAARCVKCILWAGQSAIEELTLLLWSYHIYCCLDLLAYLFHFHYYKVSWHSCHQGSSMKQPSAN